MQTDPSTIISTLASVSYRPFTNQLMPGEGMGMHVKHRLRKSLGHLTDQVGLGEKRYRGSATFAAQGSAEPPISGSTGAGWAAAFA